MMSLLRNLSRTSLAQAQPTQFIRCFATIDPKGYSIGGAETNLMASNAFKKKLYDAIESSFEGLELKIANIDNEIIAEQPEPEPVIQPEYESFDAYRKRVGVQKFD